MIDRLYTLNDSYFNQINTEEKAYFLGLLFTDGTNYENGYIKIDLIESDCYILERLKKSINYTGDIHHYPAESKIINGKKYSCQPSCRLSFLSREMSKTLSDYGIIPNKSKLGNYVKNNVIPDYLYNHWVRGLIDGDGGIDYWIDNENTGHKKFQINFCSVEDSVNKLADFLGNKFNCKPCIQDRYPDKDNNNLQLCISGNKIVREITDWLYKNATIYLQRKYDKYQELIQENERVDNNKTLYGSMKPRRKVLYRPTGIIYDSLADAERATGINRSNICVQAKKGTGKWIYYDNPQNINTIK